MKRNLICEICQTSFSTIDHRQRFCSRSCTAKYSHFRRKHKDFGNCKVCQTSLNKNQKLFCCHSCSASYSNKGRKVSDKTKTYMSNSAKLFYKNNPTHFRRNRRNKSYISFCKVCGVCIPNSTVVPLKSCSQKCLTILQQRNGKKSASKRVLRSKDEIKLYNLCASYFDVVQHNIKVVDGWDADIILPNYKIAILWNGPWHYKQLPLKNHHLLQVQNRDHIKIKLLKENGWNVMIFEDRYYTPNSAFEYIKNGCGYPTCTESSEYESDI